MDFLGDKRLLYAIAAVIVVVILAAVFWPRNQPIAPPAPATTSAPAATPTAPSTTAPKP
jgi:hypothetical protein